MDIKRINTGVIVGCPFCEYGFFGLYLKNCYNCGNKRKLEVSIRTDGKIKQHDFICADGMFLHDDAAFRELNINIEVELQIKALGDEGLVN